MVFSRSDLALTTPHPPLPVLNQVIILSNCVVVSLKVSLLFIIKLLPVSQAQPLLEVRFLTLSTITAAHC